MTDPLKPRLRERVARLVAKLDSYALHPMKCKVWALDSKTEQDCNCGLTKVRDGLRTALAGGGE